MAASLGCSCFLFLVALLPTFGGCIRPFTVPTNLFVQGTSPNTLPDGVRMIRRGAHDEVDQESTQELVEDLHRRYRRDSGPEPEVSLVSLSQSCNFLSYKTYFICLLGDKLWLLNDEHYVAYFNLIFFNSCIDLLCCMIFSFSFLLDTTTHILCTGHGMISAKITCSC